MLCAQLGVRHRSGVNLAIRATLGDPDTWKAILIDGMLKDKGMVSFAKVLTPEQAQLIRLYVIDEAHWARKNLGGAKSMAPAPAAQNSPSTGVR